MPPLLLALDGLEDVAALVASAAGALRRAGVDAEPKVVFTPDGAVVSKASRVKDLRPNCVLILSCGEPFDAASVPERARRMHMAGLRQAQHMPPMVRADHRELMPALAAPVSVAAQPSKPWMFSPSGRWSSPLALRPGGRLV